MRIKQGSLINVLADNTPATLERDIHGDNITYMEGEKA